MYTQRSHIQGLHISRGGVALRFETSQGDPSRRLVVLLYVGYTASTLGASSGTGAELGFSCILMGSLCLWEDEEAMDMYDYVVCVR